ESLLRERRHDQGGNARAGTEAVDRRRRDVVPGAAVLVVGDDDGAAAPERAPLEPSEDARHLVIAARDVGITAMLALRAARLPERHRGQAAVGDRGQQVGLVLQVLGARRRALAVAREVDERLMMELEQSVRLAGERVVPAAGIPGPADAFVAEAVA